MNHSVEPQSDRIIRKREVMQITGYRAASTLYDHIKKGIFPKQIKVGPRCSGWLKSEIDAWIADAVKARDAA